MTSHPTYIQAERILRLSTPLGADALLPERLVLREEISALGEAVLWVRAKDPDLQPDSLLGKLVDIGVEIASGQYRNWNLLVTDMIAGPRMTRGMASWQIVMRPQLWLLSRRSDCRVWQGQTALDVAQTLLSEHGLPAPDTSGVVGSLPAQHYSVQWNETDLAYLTRRLEADGLFYWFEHEAGRHVLRLASHASGYVADDHGDLRFAAGSTDRNQISRLETRFSYTPGAYAGRDWNFESPAAVPGGNAPSLVRLAGGELYEMFSYPSQGGYGSGGTEGIGDSAVERVARMRMQAAEAGHARTEGAGTVRTLAPGHRFQPYDVADPNANFREYVTFAVEHEVTDASYETGGGQPEYANRFIALPSDVPATPDLTTPAPRIDGTQVAIVAGPAGEEIHTDAYGRIKLWFPWDRRAAKDGGDSCWVRVSQSSAGAGFGSQVIPRVGMEVMVTYLDGDPDRPIVTGAVPNASQKVPYDLPGNKTKMVMRTNSHKGEGFNEMSFEDEAGQENMFFHAQKDQTTRVRNDRVKRVDRHEVSAVGMNRAVEVGGNQKHEIGGSLNMVVGGAGASAVALMGSVAGLAANSAAMLQEAGQLAGGGGPGLETFAGSLASSGLGFHSTAGLAGRAGIVGGASNRGDAGSALGASGSSVGAAAAGLFPLSGMMNTIVGSFKSDTVGVASVEQIGVSKVVNVGGSAVESVGKQKKVTVGESAFEKIGSYKEVTVGGTAIEGVGKYKKITVGEEFVIECGASKLIMRQDGTVIILGTQFNFTASGPAQINGSVVDLNKPGPSGS
ncbi:MAG: type VI secretion system tip protein TssI/VgrG [Paracoccus sp. (in: a-proteobacteria)]|nr:type VI secretion system tip protein TssI/VgrG [Paracoccus sp. (in: a-proteobacteria)]